MSSASWLVRFHFVFCFFLKKFLLIIMSPLSLIYIYILYFWRQIYERLFDFKCFVGRGGKEWRGGVVVGGVVVQGNFNSSHTLKKFSQARVFDYGTEKKIKKKNNCFELNVVSCRVIK